MANLTKAELRLWVWRGNLLGEGGGTGDPNYILTKHLIPGEETIVFEISELIKDLVTVEFDGNYDALVQTSWVKWRIERTYDDDSTDHKSELGIAFRGYGNLEDGINPELSKGLLTSNTIFYNVCGRQINIPTYTGQQGATEVTYSQDGNELASQDLGSAERFYISTTTLRLNPPADDVVTIDKTATIVAQPIDSTDNSLIPSNTDKVEITNPDGTTTIVTIECFDLCNIPATPHKISFLNKFGVMQDMWFFGTKKDGISSQRELYKKSKLKSLSTGASYNISDHENVYLRNQGKETIKLNTGFVHEQYNEVIKELMVSEYVYIHDPGRRSPTNPNFDLAIPIKIVSNSLDFKTRRKDKLIQYELEFEADADFVQSIR